MNTAEMIEPEVTDKTAVTIRRDIAQVESTLTEFDKVAAGLEALRERFPIDLVYDVQSSKGMAEAKAHRAAWRDPRITVEKFRKAGKAPVLTLGKNIDARAAWLTEQLLIGETPIDEQIKAEEARQAQIKADKEAAEFGRVMAMQEAVGEIAMLAMVNGLPSIAIAARLESLRTEALDQKVYQEMLPQAEAARTAAIGKLEQAFKAAQWDEAEAKRRADEAERLRAEQAEADVERARVTAAQAEEAKRLQEARDMIARAEREAAEQIEAGRKKLAEERAAWLAEQEAAAAAPRRAAEERMARCYDAANKRVGPDLPYEVYLRFAGDHGEKVPLEMVDEYIAALNALQAQESHPVELTAVVPRDEVMAPEACESATGRGDNVAPALAIAPNAQAPAESAQVGGKDVLGGHAEERPPSATVDTLMLLRDALALTLYAGQPFVGKFPAHPKPSPEWWAGLREQIETLQPLLIAAIEQDEAVSA